MRKRNFQGEPSARSSMEKLVERDRSAISAAEKVRFFSRPVSSGRGSILTDPQGRELIDLSATWTAAGIGYADARIREVVEAVLADCPSMGIGSLINPVTVKLAEELSALTDTACAGDSRRVYFGHSGSDANDIAIRMCRSYARDGGPGNRVLAFEQGYHAGFGEALGVSGVQVEGGAPRDPEVTFLPYPNAVHPHSESGGAAGELDYCLESVSAAASAGDVACLIVEPILSDGGMVVPPDGFLKGLRGICDFNGIPMICDEVKVGLGRSGEIHAYRHDGVHPDIVTFGKALGAGLPISAIVGPSDILDHAPGSSLLTMGGDPICAAAALKFLRILVDDGLPERAGRMGEWARSYLRKRVMGLDGPSRNHIVDIRGRGLAIGVEVTGGIGGAGADERFAEKVCFRANELGVVVYYVGRHVLEITPALNIDRDLLARALDRLIRAISDVAHGLVPNDAVDEFGGW